MSTSTDDYARPELLVDPAWILERQDDPTIRLIDCGSAEARSAACYQRAHIPSAAELASVTHPWLKGAHPDTLNREGTGRRLPADLPWPLFTTSGDDDWLHVMTPEAFSTVMEQLGVSDDTTVVAYDDEGGPNAARLWWVLNLYGHNAVKVLDGGWQRWVAETGTVATGPEPPPEPGNFTVKADNNLRCGLEELRNRLDDPNLQVIDARDDSEWSGTEDLGLDRAGRIPGAVHLEWIRFMTPELTFRPASELQTLVRQQDVTAGREIVTYCFAGVRAAHVAFVLTLLGWDHVRVYDASMFEWASREDTPLIADRNSTGA